MLRGSALTIAVICGLVPLVAEGQNRAATFPRGAIKAVAAPQSVRTARSGFRGFRGAVPLFGGVGGLAYGYGHEQNLLYRLGRIPIPPYFALHPPVYYTEPIAMPYGASPYARRPDGGCYDAVAKSAVIVNPHIKQPDVEKKETPEKTASNTRLIINPFYLPRQNLMATKE